MMSFFGSQCLRDAVVERVREHQRLDQIAQKFYWDGSKGCAIGCVLHSGEYMAFEQQLGLPVFLAYLDEHIFENLPLGEAKAWPLRFIEAVPVGVDLELVFPRFMHWLLSETDGVRKYADARTGPILDMLVAMYARRIEGIPFDVAAAWAAGDAAGAAGDAAGDAWAAAGDAAGAAGDAAGAAGAAGDAAGAAWAAAWAAAMATRDAAWAAAWAASDSAMATRHAAGYAVMAAAGAARAAAWSARYAAGYAVMAAAGAASDSARYAAIRRQSDYLIALLQGYESQPLADLPPCTEQMQALHFAVKG